MTQHIFGEWWFPLLGLPLGLIIGGGTGWLVVRPRQRSHVAFGFSGCNMSTHVDYPIVGSNNNVAFPINWTVWQCAEWRCKNNCPGCGWTRENGFTPVGVPTEDDRKMANILNRRYSH